MVKNLSQFETDCLLKAVHHEVMQLRSLDACGSEDYGILVSIEKYLLDTDTLELSNNLPF